MKIKIAYVPYVTRENMLLIQKPIPLENFVWIIAISQEEFPAYFAFDAISGLDISKTQFQA
jgi:hypothetical protein